MSEVLGPSRAGAAMERGIGEAMVVGIEVDMVVEVGGVGTGEEIAGMEAGEAASVAPPTEGEIVATVEEIVDTGDAVVVAEGTTTAVATEEGTTVAISTAET